MTIEGAVTSFVISLFASLIAVVVVLWLERFKRDCLTLSIGEGHEIPLKDPAGREQAKWLHVTVSNRNVPKVLAWAFTGDHAFDCRAWITYYHVDGTKVFNREMEGRWSLTIEPEVIERRVDSGSVYFVRNYREGIDLPPGEHTPVDIAVRYANESHCYGWNNESYATNGRNPNWLLPAGRYLVKVHVRSSGINYVRVFMLVNDVPYQGFRLEPCTNYRDVERAIATT